MSTKQVTITVTQSIHQVDKNGKVKKSLTTYEVMKPVETLKQVATQNTWVQGRRDEAKEKLIVAVKLVNWWCFSGKNVPIQALGGSVTDQRREAVLFRWSYSKRSLIFFRKIVLYLIL